MSLNRRKREQLRAHCDELRDDDGVDPREFFRDGGGRKRDIRKDRQLCAQVRDTLDLVLSGACDDDLLHNLQVVRVDPAPDSSQLLVTVSQVLGGHEVEPAEILARLAAATGRLRCEVAASISRKRVPRLLFQVLAATEDEERSHD